MPNPLAISPDRWAEVRVHDRIIRYYRSGVGRPVLVLQSSDEPAAVWPELVDALAADVRVLVPEVPAACTDVAFWLADLLEGLGVANVALVAAGRLCIPALEYVLVDADLVSRLTLIPEASTQETSLDGSLAGSGRSAPIPLLVVRRDRPAHQAIETIGRFLESGVE